jgi:hypothetical protein
MGAAANCFAEIKINEILTSNTIATKSAEEQKAYVKWKDPQGEYEDWIELYNTGGSSVNVGGMYLTDDMANPQKWRIPTNAASATTIKAGEYLVIWADGDTTAAGLHANFSLSTDGEELALYAADGTSRLDSVEYGQQYANISFGRFPDGNDAWRYLGVPTPGDSCVRSYQGAAVTDEVEFSQERGFYDTPFTLKLSTRTPGATIYFTVDGNDPVAPNGQPGASARLGAGAITISRTTCVRAAAVKAGYLSSPTRTATYLFLSDIIHQSSSPADFPATWGSTHVDYGMDSRVVDSATYSPTIQNDLKTIPSVSIVMKKSDLFDTKTGIYANLTGHGVAWERASSIEWIDPTTGANFQVNTGIRMHGSPYGRSSSVGKHAFRILFKGAYGPSELEYPLFKDGDIEHFDTLVLRSIWNFSWYGDGQGISRADYLRDLFCRDTVRDMGNLSPRGRPVHVYLDGLYWGLYILSERPDDGFAAIHMGGDKEDYDIIDTTDDSPPKMQAAAGDMTAWNNLFALAAKDLSTAQNYQAIQSSVNLTNLIDYMLMIYVSGSRDAPTFLGNDSVPHNVFAVRDRNPASPFLFLPWDVEWVLEDATVNRVSISFGSNGPYYLINRLKANADFKMLMADRIYRFLANDGALTSGMCISRYNTLAQEIDRAIVGESARWGDATGTLHTRADWVTEVNRILNQYLPGRTATVLNQLKSAGLYPTISPPDFYVTSQLLHGGHVPAGTQVSMKNTNTGTSTIKYTLDGGDPRASTGSSSDVSLVSENASKKVFVPTGPISDTWRGGATFDDSAWTASTGGAGGVGYDTLPNSIEDYTPLISLNVQSKMYNKNGSCYIRIPFTVSAADVSKITKLTLSLRCDDGFVAYINGVEAARDNFDGTPAWNSLAKGDVFEFDAVELQDYTLSTAAVGAIVAGQNILAIQGLNDSVASPDFLISAAMKGSKTPTTLVYSSPIPLSASTVIKARVLSGTTWSALNEAVYAVGPVTQSLRVSEIMYHPLDPNAEFIELTNIGSAKINLNLVRFTRGIDFTFGNTELAPGAFVVVVEDLAAFRSRYGDSVPVAGQYTGQLSNGGEEIRLEDAAGQVIEDFNYRDDWYDLTDGAGFSLTVRSSAVADANGLSDESVWRPSAFNGGSPGTDDEGMVPEPGSIVINELMANPKSGGYDWIELHNTTTQAINLGDWFLSDDANDLTKYQIASGTMIDANGYIVFYEDAHFSNPADPGCHVKFGLSRDGEAVYLSSGSAGVVTGYGEHEKFGATQKGVSLGRVRKSTGSYNFVEMSVPTPGAANDTPKVGPIVISEIMYNPSGDPDAEYVELLNISEAAVSLYDSGAATPWRFTDDPDKPTIELLFPSESPVTLLPGQYAVVTKNAAAFLAQFSVPEGVRVLAWDGGWLPRAGGKIQLSKPSGDGYWIRVDRVVYSDGLHAGAGEPNDPWPAAANGTGQSLTRIDPTAYGNDPVNWKAAQPSPGRGNP